MISLAKPWRSIVCALAGLAALAPGGAARAQNFEYTSGSRNPANFTHNGSGYVFDYAIRLTAGGQNEVSSVFAANPLSCNRFSTYFWFQLQKGPNNGPTGDGITFVIQRAGPGVIGMPGSALGYGGNPSSRRQTTGIPNSVAIKFDAQNYGSAGASSTGIYINGATPSVPAVDLSGTGVDFRSGHAFAVSMDYDGAILSVRIEDAENHALASQAYPIDIPAVVGGRTAYAGFTASSGRTGAGSQLIDAWGYQSETPNVLCVAPTGDDSNPGTSWAGAKRSIEGAMAAAAPGTQVWVAEGTYITHAGMPAGVELYGGFSGMEARLDQRDVVTHTTVLSGGGTGTVLYLAPGETGQRVDGFTITAGETALYLDGGAPDIHNNIIKENIGGWCAGIFGDHGTRALITGNRIFQNESSGDGGGALFIESAPYIAFNDVSYNTGRYGGGINLWRCGDSRVNSNTVVYNRATVANGGICVNNQTLGGVCAWGNVIVGNTAPTVFGEAGGMAIWNCTYAIVRENGLYSNYGGSAGGISCGGMRDDLEISYNDIQSNTSGYVGGILVSDQPNLTFYRNEIQSNEAPIIGGVGLWRCTGRIASNDVMQNSGDPVGGLHMDGCTLRVSGNYILFNEGPVAVHSIGNDLDFAQNYIRDNNAAGVYLWNSSGALTNNFIHDGNAEVWGGAAVVVNECPSFSVLNNTIVEAGGIGVYRSTAQIVNNVIAWVGTGIYGESSVVNAHHNGVFGNGADFVGVTSEGHDVQADPLLGVEYGEYSPMDGSPLIDRGDDSLVLGYGNDFQGRLRIQGNRVDIGAYESSSTADREAPVTTAAENPNPNTAAWNNSPVTVDLSAIDGADAANVRSITYRATGAEPHDETVVDGASAQVVISVEGETQLHYFATDKSGNTEAEKVLTLKIDRTAPSTTHTLVSGKLTLKATDALSGISASYYSVDGGAAQTYAGLVSVTTTGPHAITYWSVDAAENTERAHTVLINSSLSVFTAAPTSVLGGAGATGTLKLSAAVPVSVDITLSTNNPAVSLPAYVTVPAGQLSATFAISTVPVAENRVGALAATLGAAVRQVTFTVRAVSVKSVTFNPTSVLGGRISTGTVTLEAIPTAGDVTVALASMNPGLGTVVDAGGNALSSITIPAGSTTGGFFVKTSAVTASTSLKVRAAANGLYKEGTLTVKPIPAASVVVNPNPVIGPATATGSVTLDMPAAPGAITVTLSSSNPALAQIVDADGLAIGNISVLEGHQTRGFFVKTSAVSVSTTVTIKAVAGGVTKSATLTIKPIGVASLTLDPAMVKGGLTSTATVTLSAPAAPGGTSVTLASSAAATAWFADADGAAITSVVVPAGQQSVAVAVKTAPVTLDKSITLKATANAIYKQAVMKVTR